MSTATKLYSSAEFFDWVSLPENRGRYFELERGEIIVLPPPGKLHGFVCGNVAGLLRTYGFEVGRGYVCTNDSGVIVEENPDTVRGLDVTFYVDDETADDMTRGYATTPPLLAVEVLSPHDRIGPTMRRVTQLIQRGVKIVWLVDLEAREVDVCRDSLSVQSFDEAATLTAEDLLPGLKIAVADLFRVPGMSTNS